MVTPTPAVATPKTTAPAAPLWLADGPEAFRATPWNTVGTTPPRMDGDALRFAVSGPYQRTELEPAVPALKEGDELYFAFSVRLDEDFPADGSSRQVITQWKNDSPGSAPVDLRVWNGQLVLHGGHGHPSGPSTFTRSLGPAPVGRWSDVVVRVRFSANPDEGSVSAWQDGEQEVGCYHPPGGTLYPGQTSYLKTGLARSPRSPGPPRSPSATGPSDRPSAPSAEGPRRREVGGWRCGPPLGLLSWGSLSFCDLSTGCSGSSSARDCRGSRLAFRV